MSKNESVHETQDLNADIAGILTLVGGMIGLHEYYRGKRSEAFATFFLNFTIIGIIVNLVRTVRALGKIGKGTWDSRLAPVAWTSYIFTLMRLLFYVVVIGCAIAALIMLLVVWGK